jgi:predicted RNase H-like HicB family nuclease
MQLLAARKQGLVDAQTAANMLTLLSGNGQSAMNHQPSTPSSQFTAVVKQDGGWWIGWIEEVPGVNAQEATREALLDSLREALREALEMNRAEARAAAGDGYAEITIVP